MNANDQHGQFTGPGEMRLVRTLPGPIDRIWDFLTDSEKRSRWFAGGPMELRKGGRLTLHFRHQNLAPDEAPPEECGLDQELGTSMDEILTRFEPPRVLAFTFGSPGESEVTIDLTPQGESVRVVLTHRSGGGDVPYTAVFGAGWHTHFARLIALLEGTPRPAFWTLQSTLKSQYERLWVAALRN
jgi:uncharacterized protein YndB with AHSA1/START domain